MSEYVSKCCGATYHVENDGNGEYASHWHVCDACGEPCDVEVKPDDE